MATMQVSEIGVAKSTAAFFSYLHSLVPTLMEIDADVEANEIFGENVKRLEGLKHKYDPDNLFSHGTRLTPRPLVVVN